VALTVNSVYFFGILCFGKASFRIFFLYQAMIVNPIS
jgi:hypothetical protein